MDLLWRSCGNHYILWRTKRETTPVGDSSPIRSAFGRNVNAERPRPRETLTGGKENHNEFLSLHPAPCGVAAATGGPGGQRLTPRPPRAERQETAIQHLVRLRPVITTYSSEQRRNFGESVIRRRFVPDSFRVLMRRSRRHGKISLKPPRNHLCRAPSSARLPPMLTRLAENASAAPRAAHAHHRVAPAR